MKLNLRIEVITILYRECRFRTALKMFKEVKPDIKNSEVFNILGGISNSLYAYDVGNLQFYILSGGCERLRTENYFDYFNIIHEKVKISDFLQGDKDFDKYFYILPLMATMLNTYEFANADKSFLGCSFEMIYSYSKEENKLFFEPMDKENGKFEWIYTTELLKLNEYKNDLIGDYVVYKVLKEDFTSNKSINHFINTPLKNLVIDNLSNILYDYKDYEKFPGVRGDIAYTNLIKHFSKLKEVVQSKGNYKNYNALLKYYKVQIIYLRNLILSGTDTFYRGEFIDTLKDLNATLVDFDGDKYIKDFEQSGKIWRNIGRLLMQLYIDITEEKIDKLLTYLKALQKIEIKSFENILDDLGYFSQKVSNI